MLLALVDNITPRHQYIFDFLFKDILGIPVKLTESLGEYDKWDGPRFSYGQPSGLSFEAAGLLSETGLHTREVHVARLADFNGFFPVKEGSLLPFDPFSMAFFILTRMEEYLPFEADEHGRFTEKLSMQHRYGMLREPVVNRLAFMVMEILQRSYPGLKPKISKVFLPTIDVDIAYAHLAKDPLRAMGGFAKLLMKGDLRSLKERWQVMGGKLDDPYDNFDLHLELAGKYGTGLIYFFLLGDYGKYDKMISHSNPRFRDLIGRLAGSAEVGIHPSYASFGDESLVRQEKERLEQIIGRQVTRHRAHFLRIGFPDTFRSLVRLGVTDDYSLGYSTSNSFRAGTANAFYYYDVLKDEQTTLRVHPFIFMDSALIDHIKAGPSSGEADIREVIGQVEKYGGEAIGIWHNYSLSEKGQYRGWQQVFKNIMAGYGQQ